MAEIKSWVKNKKDLKFKEKSLRKGWEILEICIIFYKCLRSKCQRVRNFIKRIVKPSFSKVKYKNFLAVKLIIIFKEMKLLKELVKNNKNNKTKNESNKYIILFYTILHFPKNESFKKRLRKIRKGAEMKISTSTLLRRKNFEERV